MSTGYASELAQRLKKKKSANRGLNTADILSAKDDIRAAIEAGFVPKDIWGDLRDNQRLHCSYDTFLRLVKKFVMPESSKPYQLHVNGIRQDASAPHPKQKAETTLPLAQAAHRHLRFRDSPLAPSSTRLLCHESTRLMPSRITRAVSPEYPPPAIGGLRGKRWPAAIATDRSCSSAASRAH